MEKAPYFEGYMRAGRLAHDRVYVMIHKKSLVICFVSRAEIAAEKRRAKEAAKQKGSRWLERTDLVRKATGEYGERFAKMDRKTALAQHKKNQEIRYEDIEKLWYSPATEDCDGEMNLFCRGRLVLKTAEKKTIIQHSLEKGAPQEQVLRQRL